MQTATPDERRQRAAPEDRRRVLVIFGALMLVLFLAALDQTIVSTALPTIVGEFGGLQHLSWVVTAYLLASTIVTPLYGKLGDLYGRKIVLQVAIVVFLAGSILCGAAWGMEELIVFRAVQGLGAGGLMVSAMATVGDVVPPRERGRYQGAFGAVFAVATVIGPLLGGFLVESLSWRWIFYVNIPIGIVALAVIATVFKPHAALVRHAIDYLGAILLAGALSSVVLFTSLGGTTWAWSSAPVFALAGLALALAAGFVLAERHAAEPIIPLELFRNRTFSVTSAIGFVIGLALFGSVTFLPLYYQVVQGNSPTVAGLQIVPLMGGVLVTSIVSGQLTSRLGRYKIFPVIGSAVTAVAMFLLSTIDAGTSSGLLILYMIMLGAGLGMVMQVLVIAVQNAVDHRFLGVATSGATLFRQIGGSVGVSLFGAIFASELSTNLAARVPAGAGLPASSDPARIAALPAGLHDAYVGAFADALQPVFLVAAGIAAAAFLLSLLLREVPLRRTVKSAEELEAAGMTPSTSLASSE